MKEFERRGTIKNPAKNPEKSGGVRGNPERMEDGCRVGHS